MATIVLRATKGTPLTNLEVDTNFNNLNVEVGTKLTATDYTAADILTKIKTVDGSGSGLDADFLDGHSYSSYAPGASAITSVARTTNVVTVITTTAHGFTIGNTVNIFGVSDTSFNGSFVILAGGFTTTNYTFTQVGTNVTTATQTRAQCYVTITDESIPDRNTTGSLTSPELVAMTTYSNLVGNVTGNVTGNTSGTALNVTGIVAIANGGTNASDIATARTNLGLGTIATQASTAVSISGGTITGITDITILDGGTSASDAGTARTNLGLAIGTNVQAYSAELAAVAGLATNGITARTGAGTLAARTITGTTGYIILTNGDGVAGNPTITVGSNIANIDVYNAFAITSAVILPVGTTAQRPATPVSGDMRYNSDLAQYEGYSGTAWGAIGGGATGGGGNTVFFENSQIITASYTITSGKSAMSTGPITVNAGAVVTIPASSKWVVL